MAEIRNGRMNMVIFKALISYFTSRIAVIYIIFCYPLYLIVFILKR